MSTYVPLSFHAVLLPPTPADLTLPSPDAQLHMSNEVPLLVEYPFAAGHIRYYLAPKISVSLSLPLLRATFAVVGRRFRAC